MLYVSRQRFWGGKELSYDQTVTALEGPASRPRHRWGLPSFLLVEAVFLATGFVGAYLIVAADARTSVAALTAGLASQGVVAAALALWIARRRGNGPVVDFRMRWSWRDVLLGLAFAFGGMFLVIPAAVLYVAVVGADATAAVGRVYEGMQASWPAAIAVFLTVAVVAPVCEEIIFRGLLWGALEQRWGRWVAAVVSTVVFAVAHLELTRAPLLLVVAIPIALARLYTDGLLAGSVVHAMTNLLPGLSLMHVLTS